MNGRERIEAALSGARPDRPPVMLHNFMHAAREAGVLMCHYRRDPGLIARVLIESTERYGLDGVLVDIDTATLAGALGVPVEFPEDRPAVARVALLDDIRHVDQLPPPDVSGYLGVQVWLQAVGLIRRYFGDAIYIRGNCDQCPFSLASLVRSMEGWLLDLMDPDLEPYCTRLLEHCSLAGRQFLELMSATGAHMVSNGDSTAGPSVISPRMYRRWALPYEKQFAETAHRLGVRYAIHVCGDTRAILPDLADCGADAVELDYKTDVDKAHDLLRDRATFIGNIDPSGVIALGTPEEITRAGRALVERFSDTGRFILNAGCAIPADTPAENIRALVNAVQ